MANVFLFIIAIYFYQNENCHFTCTNHVDFILIYKNLFSSVKFCIFGNIYIFVLPIYINSF